MAPLTHLFPPPSAPAELPNDFFMQCHNIPLGLPPSGTCTGGAERKSTAEVSLPPDTALQHRGLADKREELLTRGQV